MINVAVTEDDPECRSMISGFIHRYAEEHELTIRLKEYPDGDELLEDFTGQFDILFLDIQMPGPDGMKTAGVIRRRDENVQIVFVTNLAQRASDGYDVDARAFLVKPVSYASVARIMDRLIRLLSKRNVRYLTFNNTREMQRISTDTILYIEGMGHYVKAHTGEAPVIALASMKEIEEKLRGLGFFRCGKSLIVNLDKIDSIDRDQIRIGDYRLSVSKTRKKELMAALDRYYAGME